MAAHSLPLLKLPGAALLAIANNLSIKERLQLGRQVLSQGTSSRLSASWQVHEHLQRDQSSWAAHHDAGSRADGFWGSSCVDSSSSTRTAAAAAVLSTINDCSIKLPHDHAQSSSILASLRQLPQLQLLNLTIADWDAPAVQCTWLPNNNRASRQQQQDMQLSVLGELSALTCLTVAGTHRQPVALCSQLSDAISRLQQLQQLSFAHAYIQPPPRSSLQTSGTLQQPMSASDQRDHPDAATALVPSLQGIVQLQFLTALEAPGIFNLLTQCEILTAVLALQPLLPQLQCLKLQGNNLGPEAALLLLQGLVGQGSSSNVTGCCGDSDRRAEVLQVLDLSKNRIFPEQQDDDDVTSSSLAPGSHYSSYPTVMSYHQQAILDASFDDDQVMQDLYLDDQHAHGSSSSLEDMAMEITPADAVPAVEAVSVKQAAAGKAIATCTVATLLGTLVKRGLKQLYLADTGMKPVDLADMFAGVAGTGSSRQLPQQQAFSQTVGSVESSRCYRHSSTGASKLEVLDVGSNYSLASVKQADDPLHPGMVLRQLQGLKHLNLSWVYLGPRGCAFLTRLTSLEHLDIRGCRPGDATVFAIEESLPKLKRLQIVECLDLNWCF